MNVDIVGEDAVTQLIIKRILGNYRPDLRVGRMLPVRGGQIKKLAPLYNRAGTPLILLTDLDNEDCAPSLIRDWLANEPVSNTMLFRVACDEAETWLMADRQGFARWLGVNVDIIPQPTQRSRLDKEMELRFHYKPSLYLMRELAPASGKATLKEDLMPRNGASKGPAYNTALTPFIEKVWDLDNASQNSDSLRRAIERVRNFNPI